MIASGGPGLLLALLLLLLMSSLSHAREYHVSPSHRQSADSNSGAISQPWRSLHKANATLQPGDTVYIHEGRYGQRIAPLNSGDASRPIVYEAWNSDDVHLAEKPFERSLHRSNQSLLHSYQTHQCPIPRRKLSRLRENGRRPALPHRGL